MGKFKYKKTFIALCIAACVIIYFLIALLPYSGALYVSAETRASFAMENFFGQEIIPEQVMLLDNPQESFFHRVNLISNAQEQIFFASYVIHSGVSTDIIVGALLSAADRGVTVKIVTDGFTGNIPATYRNVLSGHENICLYRFNSFNFFRPQYANSSFHDKYMTVDNRYMILGGRNVGDKYFLPSGFTGRQSLDREVLVYNTDLAFSGIIAEVNDLFNETITSSYASSVSPRSSRNSEAERAHFIALYNAYKASLPPRDFDYLSNTVGVYNITLLHDPIGSTKKESVIAYNLMMMTLNSERIIAQSPYLVMTNRTLEIFADTVRGRDFTLLTNSLASTPNLPAFSSYYVNRRNILQTGITIYEFQATNTSIHAKTYLFDGRLTVIGSFNLNERSIRSDTESVLVIDSREFHDLTLDVINGYMARSLRVAADNTYEPNDHVDAIPVSRRRRALYQVAGHLLRGVRFMI